VRNHLVNEVWQFPHDLLYAPIDICVCFDGCVPSSSRCGELVIGVFDSEGFLTSTRYIAWTALPPWRTTASPNSRSSLRVRGNEAASYGVTSLGTIIGIKLMATPAHGRMNRPMARKNGLASALLPSDRHMPSATTQFVDHLQCNDSRRTGITFGIMTKD
jgi:hypothetical protein